MLASLVVGGLAVWTMIQPGPAASPPPAQFALSLPLTDQLTQGRFAGLALSPDGQDLVYVASRDGIQQLFHRSMGALDALPMRGTEGAFFPFFSPDGNWVGFFSGDSVKKVLLTGGPPITLTATGSVPQLGASWSADGTVLFTHVQAPGIMRVSEAGGEAQPLTTGDDEVRHQWMDSLPDGKGVLFTLWSGSLGTTRIAVQSPDMTEPMVLADGKVS